jgi:hypothetical protein
MLDMKNKIEDQKREREREQETKCLLFNDCMHANKKRANRIFFCVFLHFIFIFLHTRG